MWDPNPLVVVPHFGLCRSDIVLYTGSATRTNATGELGKGLLVLRLLLFLLVFCVPLLSSSQSSVFLFLLFLSSVFLFCLLPSLPSFYFSCSCLQWRWGEGID